MRIKRGTISLKRRRSVLKRAKGYRWGRSSKERSAREALLHAGNFAFAHRRKKKGDFRRLWSTQLSAAFAPFELSYSRAIFLLKEKKVELNRKVLSVMAQEYPELFEEVVTFVKK